MTERYWFRKEPDFNFDPEVQPFRII